MHNLGDIDMMRVKKTVFYLLALFVALPSVATAGRVIQASVSHDDGVYSLLVEMEIQADAHSIRKLLTDFDKMGLYNESVVDSSRWYSPEPQVVVGRIEIRDCVLFFCATLVQVQKIRELPSGDLQVTILPHLSDYSMGKSLWHIVQQADGSTRLRVEAVMAPKLWVPPLIGPAMVSNLLKERALSMMENLETLTRPHP